MREKFSKITGVINVERIGTRWNETERLNSDIITIAK